MSTGITYVHTNATGNIMIPFDSFKKMLIKFTEVYVKQVMRDNDFCDRDYTARICIMNQRAHNIRARITLRQDNDMNFSFKGQFINNMNVHIPFDALYAEKTEYGFIPVDAIGESSEFDVYDKIVDLFKN